MQKFRRLFPILEHSSYINSCSHGALSVPVRQAYIDYLDLRETKGADWYAWEDKLNEVRSLLSTLLSCDEAELAVTASVSAALNALVSALHFNGDRNRVICTDLDFPTTAQIWHAQAARGAEVEHIACLEDGCLDEQALFDSLDERVKLVSIPQVCYRNGVRIKDEQIKRISRRAREVGALVILDSYQAVGTMEIKPRDLGVHVLLGGAQKYLLASAGVGFMYIENGLIEQLKPSHSGWFAQADVHAMKIHANEPALDARRFEEGTPNVPNLYAAAAGIRLVLETGVAAISEQIGVITAAIIAGSIERGYCLATPVTAHGAMVAIQSHDMNALVERVAEHNIVISCRDGNIRIAPHAYNNLADVAQLFTALEANQALLVQK